MLEMSRSSESISISLTFGKRCREAGVRPSMESVGDCPDNAMCESLFAILEVVYNCDSGSGELIGRHCFHTHSKFYCYS